MGGEEELEELIDRCNKFAGSMSSVAKYYREVSAALPKAADDEGYRRSLSDFGDAFYEMSDFWMELYSYVLDVYKD